MNDTRELVKAIEAHLAEDERQLAAIQHQADAVAEALDGLMARLRIEIEAAADGRDGAYRLRG